MPTNRAKHNISKILLIDMLKGQFTSLTEEIGNGAGFRFNLLEIKPTMIYNKKNGDFLIHNWIRFKKRIF